MYRLATTNLHSNLITLAKLELQRLSHYERHIALHCGQSVQSVACRVQGYHMCTSVWAPDISEQFSIVTAACLGSKVAGSELHKSLHHWNVVQLRACSRGMCQWCGYSSGLPHALARPAKEQISLVLVMTVMLLHYFQISSVRCRKHLTCFDKSSRHFVNIQMHFRKVLICFYKN